jgi:hypothetical protein
LVTAFSPFSIIMTYSSHPQSKKNRSSPMKDIDFAKTKSIATRETPVVFRIYYNEKLFTEHDLFAVEHLVEQNHKQYEIDDVCYNTDKRV